MVEWNAYNINVYNFGKPTPSYYMYALVADRKLIHYVNQVILRMYDQDRVRSIISCNLISLVDKAHKFQFENFWTFRHLRSLRNLPTNDTQVLDYKPMNFLRLSIIFYIFIGLISLSIIVFVFELVACLSVSRSVVRRSLAIR